MVHDKSDNKMVEERRGKVFSDPAVDMDVDDDPDAAGVSLKVDLTMYDEEEEDVELTRAVI